MGALELLNKPCKSWLAGEKLLLHLTCTARLQCEPSGIKSHSLILGTVLQLVYNVHCCIVLRPYQTDRLGVSLQE